VPPVWVSHMVIKGKGLGGVAICIVIILWGLKMAFWDIASSLAKERTYPHCVGSLAGRRAVVLWRLAPRARLLAG
jgi:hypothetical protein